MTRDCLRQMLMPGVRVRVTNHYITREDHPCFGTRDCEVLASNSASFTLSTTSANDVVTRPPSRPSPIRWPKRDQIVEVDENCITILSGGVRQSPDEPFMTIQVLA